MHSVVVKMGPGYPLTKVIELNGIKNILFLNIPEKYRIDSKFRKAPKATKGR